METEGYRRFVCVEVGTVSEIVLLKSQGKWEAGQIILA
jgi:D-hexose-6-phosphate mutarotase